MKRRVLYGMAAAAWAGAGYFLALDLHEPHESTNRTWMILVLTVAAVLSTASLFVFFIPTSDAIYRSGIEAGRQMAGCQAFKPILTAVDEQRPGATVTSIRTLHTNS